MRREYMRSSAAAARAAAPAAAAAAPAPSEWEQEQRAIGRRRRAGEEKRRARIAACYLARCVRQVGETKIAEVHVTVAPHYELCAGDGRSTVCVRLPLDASAGTWRPRVSRLLFTKYLPLLRRLVLTLREGCTDNWTPLAQLASTSRPDSGTCTAAAQSVQRMFVYILFAEEELAEAGGARRHGAIAGTAIAGRGCGSAALRTLHERVGDERRKLDKVFDRLRQMAYGLPGAVHPGARSAMLHAYCAARLYAPNRASMVSLLAMRVSCVLWAMVPHLVPMAPERNASEVLAAAAEREWRRRYPALAEAVDRNCSA